MCSADRTGLVLEMLCQLGTKVIFAGSFRLLLAISLSRDDRFNRSAATLGGEVGIARLQRTSHTFTEKYPSGARNIR